MTTNRRAVITEFVSIGLVVAAAVIGCGSSTQGDNAGGPTTGGKAGSGGGAITGSGGAAGRTDPSGTGGVAGTGGVSSGGAGAQDAAVSSNGDGADGRIEGTVGVKADAGGSGGTASSGGARNDGGSIDAGSACQQAAAVDRTCTAITDCVVVKHQTDYIGQVSVLGIRSSEMARFAELEKSCKATMTTFHLPATTADDGSLVDASSKAVACESGFCTTFSPACAQPCSSNHVCITCGTGANAKSVCSQVCSMAACTEAPRTSCLGGTSVNGGEGEFCFDPIFTAGFMSSSCHR
jgi:hypothetical protein